MLVIAAFPDPLLSSCMHLPSSALNILIIVPRIDADATNVPSQLTASAPTSDSCALISTFAPLSPTVYNEKD
jgi:hypothetical protein